MNTEFAEEFIGAFYIAVLKFVITDSVQPLYSHSRIDYPYQVSMGQSWDWLLDCELISLLWYWLCHDVLTVLLQSTSSASCSDF